MTQALERYLRDSSALLARTAEYGLTRRVETAIAEIAGALGAGRAMLVCGNGGSAADAMHIAGELVARFLIERPGLKVIALGANPAALTAWSNDYDYETAFSRQVEAFGEPGGVLFGLSTSGNSKNVVRALEQARDMRMKTIALTGEGGGAMAALCDVLIDVPSRSTPRIQEVHVALYHFICRRVEEICAGLP